MLTIIAKGKVYKMYNPGVEPDDYYLVVDISTWLALGQWAKDYEGKTIVISLEEEEPILNENLEALLVPA